MISETTLEITCERCGNVFTNIQACHQKCLNCGNERTCSDL